MPKETHMQNNYASYHTARTWERLFVIALSMKQKQVHLIDEFSNSGMREKKLWIS